MFEVLVLKDCSSVWFCHYNKSDSKIASIAMYIQAVLVVAVRSNRSDLVGISKTSFQLYISPKYAYVARIEDRDSVSERRIDFSKRVYSRFPHDFAYPELTENRAQNRLRNGHFYP